jgi:hypothetical protein
LKDIKVLLSVDFKQKNKYEYSGVSFNPVYKEKAVSMTKDGVA